MNSNPTLPHTSQIQAHAINDLAWAEQALRRVSQAMAHVVEDDFFPSLVKNLVSILNVRYAFLTRSADEKKERAAILAYCDRDTLLPTYEYSLKDTPCRIVYDGNTVFYPCNLGDHFASKKQSGLESYCGMPLLAPTGEVMGHLAVFDNVEMTHEAEIKTILQIFAMRASAELERIRLRSEREKLILDLRSAVERVERQRAALSDLNQFKSDLLGILAHDLKNPLTTILLNSQLLKMQTETQPTMEAAKVATAMDSIESGCRRILEQIKATLDDASNESKTLSIKPGYFCIDDLTASVIENLRPSAEKKQIQLNYANRFQCHVTLDELRCHEILENLISNAIKFSPEDKTVTVETVCNERHLSIIVTDQGQGLTQEDLGKMFQRYQRLSAKPTAGESSTGLGLAIVKQLVELQGGTISASSPGPNQGATFTVTFPI